MSFDIYGNNLRRGHCEVHPHVHEEYPCSVCLAESQRQAEHQPEYCDGDPRYCESAYYLGQASDRIKELEAERRWRTDLPPNIDECMEIAVKLTVGWYRCIGYVLQDLSITDFDQNHIGYDWGDGCYWRPISTDAELAAQLREGEE